MPSIELETITSSMVLDPNFSTFAVDASGGDITITLPEIDFTDGINYVLIRIDTSSHVVTVQGTNTTSSETINGLSSITISSVNSYISFISLNNVWIQSGSLVAGFGRGSLIPYNAVITLNPNNLTTASILGYTVPQIVNTAIPLNTYTTIGAGLYTNALTITPPTTNSLYWRAPRCGTLKNLLMCFSLNNVLTATLLGSSTLTTTANVYVASPLAISSTGVVTAPTFTQTAMQISLNATSANILSGGGYFTIGTDFTHNISVLAGDLISVEIATTLSASGVAVSDIVTLTVGGSIEFA